MSKDSSKKACGRYQNLSEDIKTKRNNMIANDIKISIKTKNKGSLGIEKIL